MYYWLIPLIIGFVLLSIFLYFRVKERRVIAVIIKGFVSLMFIVTAVIAWQSSKNPQSNFGIFVLCGLFFGLLGDILLDLKYIVLDHEMLFTRLGFCAFGIGHIFFTTGLFLNFYNYNSNILYLILPIVVALILLTITLLMEKFSAIRYTRMKLFVIGYGLCLFFTTSIFFSAAIQSNFKVTTLVIFAIALIFFMLSDLILNNTYFAKGFNGPAYIIVNHTLYYIAQFAIAVSLFFLL